MQRVFQMRGTRKDAEIPIYVIEKQGYSQRRRRGSKDDVQERN
jgi:hypothetical protein